jgi:hypothetical protein
MLAAMARGERPGGWHNRDFHDEVPRRLRVLERMWLSVAVAVPTFFIMVFAASHEANDCGNNCHDGDGILPYQPGHPWTGYRDSWQWQAQWFLGVGSFGIAALALLASSRRAWRRWALVANVLAVACGAAWVVWALLEPANPV